MGIEKLIPNRFPFNIHHKYLCGSLVAYTPDDGGTHPWAQAPVQTKKAISLLDEPNCKKNKKLLSKKSF